MGHDGPEEAPLFPTQVAPLQACWSIGLYHGDSPLALTPATAGAPILTAEHVTDVVADFVADPFCHVVGRTHVLFFEIWNRALQRGEIACASSRDLTSWRYDGVVLRDAVHLSYPCVFAHASDVFMIPETREAGAVRLYRAEAFPHRWRFVCDLVHGDFADATPFHHEGRWWLFAHRGLDELRLYSARELDGPYEEHPASPIVAGNRRTSRPAGRVINYRGRVLRFAQDAWPHYGSRVRALEIDHLSTRGYAEHELAESPILEGSGSGWNALGMHHVELLPQPDGRWSAIVDGYTPAGFQ